MTHTHALALAAVLCCCGGDDFDPPQTVGEACTYFAEAVCDQAPRCVPNAGPYELCFQGVYDICCRSDGTCGAAFAGRHDPGGFHACIDAYDDLSCDLLLADVYPPECQAFIQ